MSEYRISGPPMILQKNQAKLFSTSAVSSPPAIFANYVTIVKEKSEQGVKSHKTHTERNAAGRCCSPQNGNGVSSVKEYGNVGDHNCVNPIP